jgi:hypothetical protein
MALKIIEGSILNQASSTHDVAAAVFRASHTCDHIDAHRPLLVGRRDMIGAGRFGVWLFADWAAKFLEGFESFDA